MKTGQAETDSPHPGPRRTQTGKPAAHPPAPGPAARPKGTFAGASAFQGACIRPPDPSALAIELAYRKRMHYVYGRTRLFGEGRRSIEHRELSHAPIQISCLTGGSTSDWTWIIDCTLALCGSCSATTRTCSAGPPRWQFAANRQVISEVPFVEDEANPHFPLIPPAWGFACKARLYVRRAWATDAAECHRAKVPRSIRTGTYRPGFPQASLSIGPYSGGCSCI